MPITFSSLFDSSVSGAILRVATGAFLGGCLGVAILASAVIS